jgi:transposase
LLVVANRQDGLVGRLAPDFKTIADFRKHNGEAIQSVCRQFVELCRRLKLFTRAVVAMPRFFWDFFC